MGKGEWAPWLHVTGEFFLGHFCWSFWMIVVRWASSSVHLVYGSTQYPVFPIKDVFEVEMDQPIWILGEVGRVGNRRALWTKGAAGSLMGLPQTDSKAPSTCHLQSYRIRCFILLIITYNTRMVPPITDRTWPIVTHAHMYIHTCKLELRSYLDNGFRPRSHQPFRPVRAPKLMGIMFEK